MDFLTEILFQMRHTDYEMYLATLDSLESDFIDSGHAEALAFVQALKAAEKGDKIAL